jgi:hypothetical protein
MFLENFETCATLNIGFKQVFNSSRAAVRGREWQSGNEAKVSKFRRLQGFKSKRGAYAFVNFETLQP